MAGRAQAFLARLNADGVFQNKKFIYTRRAGFCLPGFMSFHSSLQGFMNGITNIIFILSLACY
jgi:hypothetical protein